MNHNNSWPVTFANFPVRAAALLFDLLLVNLVLIPVRLMYLTVNMLLEGSFLSATILFQYNIGSICCYIITALYFVLTTYYTGQTLGKKIFEIRVVSKEGSPLRFTDIIYRETIGRFLSSLFFVGYILVLADQERKSLHDNLCDTRVICLRERVREKKQEETENQSFDEP